MFFFKSSHFFGNLWGHLPLGFHTEKFSTRWIAWLINHVVITKCCAQNIVQISRGWWVSIFCFGRFCLFFFQVLSFQGSRVLRFLGLSLNRPFMVLKLQDLRISISMSEASWKYGSGSYWYWLAQYFISQWKYAKGVNKNVWPWPTIFHNLEIPCQRR